MTMTDVERVLRMNQIEERLEQLDLDCDLHWLKLWNPAGDVFRQKQARLSQATKLRWRKLHLAGYRGRGLIREG